MARPVVLSNGELHVGINSFGEVHDFYYPYVGLENHAAGRNLRHHVGVWVDGQISWLDDGKWEFDFSYPHDSLVGHTIAKNHELGIMLELDDAADAEFSAFMRNIHVINMQSSPRDVRLFLHQAFDIGDAGSNTDTAQYLPDAKAILHYRGRRARVISAQSDGKEFFDQYTVGLFGIEGRDGTYRDAEDGELEMCAVEHGRVDSTLRFKLDLAPHSSARIHYWIACGTSTREALYIHKQLQNQGLHRRLDATSKWWHEWLKPAIEVAGKIDPAHREQFLRSCMIIKSHIDKRGAVIASTDSSMLNYGRDAYAYCWPRDGAYVLWPLIRMGYKDEPYRFFEFCRRALNPGGFLMHKYRADGALGSSWHSYVHEGGVTAPPIQEDETALVLFVFSQFYHTSGNNQVLLKEFYEPMVLPMADFLARYVDARTGLPKPTYDLWEEQFMTTTYSTAVTYAALMAAADLAEVRSDSSNAVKWRSAAESIRQAAEKHLYNEERKAFYKGIRVVEDGTITPDPVIDMSSIFGSFMYGLFPIGSDQTKHAFATAKSVFNFGAGGEPGIPRYEDDNYRRAGDKPNWWFVTTLWAAQYYLETGETEAAHVMLDWVRDSAWPTGMLSEQINPDTRNEMSVSPLNWSQAEYISTLLDTITES